MADKQIYPMISEKSWWQLRNQFKKTIPSVVNVSYLKSLLSLNSDQSARNILAPLRQMGIIDADGKPQPRATDWRSDAKYPDVCSAIIAEIYPQELLWGDRIFEKCGIRRDEEGDGGKTLEIRGKRRLSARDGGANYQQS